MADAALTVLLETLSHILLSCSDLIPGSEDDLRLLRDEVGSFRTFLRSVANKPKEEVAFRAIAGRIEEVVYDAQDTIDSYLIEAAQSKIDHFPGRPKAVANRRAEAVQSFREYRVRPVLVRATKDFANMLQPNPAAAAIPLPKNLSELFAVLEGDLNPGAEEELRLLKNDVEKLRNLFRHLKWKIDELISDAPEMINYYLSQIDLFRGRCCGELYSKGSSSLAEVVRSLREDKVKPMLEQARIDFSDVLLTGDGSDAALEEPHTIKVNTEVWFGEDRTVGVEDEQATITGYLKEEKYELGSITIIGVAGMGKTTLAKRVYQSQEIQYEFPTRIWITVSQDYRTRDVFLQILKEVTSRDMWSVSEDELASAVYRFLGKRKFLLVLDDVWDVSVIDTIRSALPRRNPGGKILITSRLREVAGHVMPSIEPRSMRFLTEDECWELLRLQVFGDLHICPPGLIEIGRDIARQCGGVPLAVVIIGGILVDELSKKQSVGTLKKAWIEMFEYIRVYTADDGWEFIDRLIKLSYERLPDELRNLFLYLGVFPEDYEIPSATLIRLWIAEGFIQHQEGRSLEDFAEEKLKRLIQRKLVIVDKVRSDGRVKSVHLHDTVRDFCIRKVQELNLFKEIEFSRKGILSFQVQNKHRRLY